MVRKGWQGGLVYEFNNQAAALNGMRWSGRCGKVDWSRNLTPRLLLSIVWDGPEGCCSQLYGMVQKGWQGGLVYGFNNQAAALNGMGWSRRGGKVDWSMDLTTRLLLSMVWDGPEGVARINGRGALLRSARSQETIMLFKIVLCTLLVVVATVNSKTLVKPGTCPTTTETCLEEKPKPKDECEKDKHCDGTLMCCPGACGHVCVEPCDEFLCALYCEYGNELDGNGCPICSCKPNPCEMTIDKHSTSAVHQSKLGVLHKRII
ncbi:hypothetical protein CAPTEDRAFT_199382 [Capitella teleta]|uniref:Antistasin-like domain-containing protein n=1 Tax=Capitella teleta TaxID=283909 RepID=R7UX67_CAPTE|nr:hypothetical protein CAPTEDRAFT_199382 [Capitella teleta]|eukprot:ELU10882.1 hypothetical protein CAPTEDRAFT_199382 [Capitella teleta]